MLASATFLTLFQRLVLTARLCPAPTRALFSCRATSTSSPAGGTGGTGGIHASFTRGGVGLHEGGDAVHRELF